MLLSFLSKESNQRKVAAAPCSLKGSGYSVPVPTEQANAAFRGYRSVRQARLADILALAASSARFGRRRAERPLNNLKPPFLKKLIAGVRGLSAHTRSCGRTDQGLVING